MQQIKAAVARKIGAPLLLETVTLAPPRAGEVQVKLAACAICHSDIAFIDGKFGGNLPSIYGHEAAGKIVALGAGVDQFEIGDPVLVTMLRSCGQCVSCKGGHPNNCEAGYDRMANSPLHDEGGNVIEHGLGVSGFAQQVIVSTSQIAPLPKSMPLDVASLIACGVITGFGAASNAAQIDKGANVVIIGAGGVGLNTIQGAVHAGAWRVIAVDVNEQKLSDAREFGATHVIKSGPDLGDQIKALCDNRGADVVFVTVGSAQVVENAPDLLAVRGQLVLVGMTAVGEKVGFETVNITAASQRIIGSMLGETDLARDIPKLVALYQDGQLKLDQLISHRYSLDQINDAIDATRAGQSRRNVIIFDD